MWNVLSEKIGEAIVMDTDDDITPLWYFIGVLWALTILLFGIVLLTARAIWLLPLITGGSLIFATCALAIYCTRQMPSYRGLLPGSLVGLIGLLVVGIVKLSLPLWVYLGNTLVAATGVSFWTLLCWALMAIVALASLTVLWGQIVHTYQPRLWILPMVAFWLSLIPITTMALSQAQ